MKTSDVLFVDVLRLIEDNAPLIEIHAKALDFSVSFWWSKSNEVVTIKAINPDQMKDKFQMFLAENEFEELMDKVK